MAERPQAFRFEEDEAIPNSRFPLLLYRRAIDPARADADAFERLFDANGWGNGWRDGIYPFHHYHSTAHEVLGIARGRARVQFGGESGRPLDVAAGDAVVIPAGVGHKRLLASSDLLVVGAYPPGQDWDLMRGRPGERPDADRRIAAVPLPETDPVMGAGGPLLTLWR